MKKIILKFITYALIIVIILEFIPIKFAINNIDGESFFVNKPKLGSSCEWMKYEYDERESTFEPIGGYILYGKSPNIALNKYDFDMTKLYLMNEENENRFFLHYDEERGVCSSNAFPVFEIKVNDWDICYPIRRASFRRYYAPKRYLTIFDFDWYEFVEQMGR